MNEKKDIDLAPDYIPQLTEEDKIATKIESEDE